VDRTLQKGLVVVYAFGLAAGLGATLFQPPSMLETIHTTGARAWGLYMLLGSLICLAGVLMRRGARGDWLGEFVGIPLVVVAVTVYGVVATATLEGTPGRVAGICLLGMLATLLIVRWFRVWDDGKRATGAGPGKASRLAARLIAKARHDDTHPPTATHV
jgi:hypothetical protein